MNENDEEDSEAFDSLGAVPAEVDYIVNQRTLELPDNLLRRRLTKSTQFSTLEYVGFRVRDKFPNNIVRMKDGGLVCVTKLISQEEEDPLEVGRRKTVHYIQGVQFDKVIQQHFHIVLLKFYF